MKPTLASPTASKPADHWQVTRNSSLLTDAPIITISTHSANYASAFGNTKAAMQLRCEEGEVSITWGFNEFLGSDFDIREGEYEGKYKIMHIRLDREEAEPFTLRVATQGTGVGLWSSKDAIPMIERIALAKTMIVGIEPYNESDREMLFVVENLSAHLPQLHTICPDGPWRTTSKG